MRIAEKERGLSGFDTDILNTFFWPTAEMTTWSPGKIGTHTPIMAELTLSH